MRSTRLVVGMLVGAIVASLAGCASPGDLLARQLAERVIIGIGDPTPRDADFLAAGVVDDPRLPHAPGATSRRNSGSAASSARSALRDGVV